MSKPVKKLKVEPPKSVKKLKVEPPKSVKKLKVEPPKPVKVKKLKVDLSTIKFKNPEKVTDGSNGRLLENGLRDQGFPVDPHATVDLPGVNKSSPGIEVKSRSKTTSSMHTIGTMTHAAIIDTPWNETTFKQKLQQQYRVTISTNPFTGEIDADGTMVDFTDPEIQKLFEEAYENCRSQLIAQGDIIPKQTITGGQFGALEHKNGKSYAMRIPDSGMKKVIKHATSTYNKLFG